jgi:hypothetical protein
MAVTVLSGDDNRITRFSENINGNQTHFSEVRQSNSARFSETNDYAPNNSSKKLKDC